MDSDKTKDQNTNTIPPEPTNPINGSVDAPQQDSDANSIQSAINPEPENNQPISSIPEPDTFREKIEIEGDTTITAKKSLLKRFGSWYIHRKRYSLPLTLLLIVGLLYAYPTTRYAIAGQVIKKEIVVVINDDKTGKPVTNALVSVDGQSTKTNQTGQATLKSIPVGYHTVTFEKKFYKSSKQNVELNLFRNAVIKTALTATGRQVTVKVVNSISGVAVEGSTVSLDAETTAITNKNGEATLVVSTANAKPEASISAAGYNNGTATINIEDDTTDSIPLTPAGSVYFLSRASGKTDVVKTNLDGTARKTVLAGTGQEDEGSTLLASHDWKYTVLSAKRDGTKPHGLYAISSSDDTVVPIDDSGDEKIPVGWQGNYFIYSTYNTKAPFWQPKRFAVKSYDVTTKKSTVIEENDAVGDNENNAFAESFSKIAIIDGRLVYAKMWERANINATPDPALNDRETAVRSMLPDGKDKKVLKGYAAAALALIEVRNAGAQSLHYRVTELNGSIAYYDYKNGALNNVDVSVGAAEFEKSHPTYLASPNKEQTFWTEERDGKFTLLLGDKAAENAKEVVVANEYTAYGWYGDQYLLIAKNNSELFIIPTNGLPVDATGKAKDPLKISDYTKPKNDIKDYGYGYGGL